MTKKKSIRGKRKDSYKMSEGMRKKKRGKKN